MDKDEGSLENEVAVMAEASFSHLVELEVASLASGLWAILLVTLVATRFLTNSGITTQMLMLFLLQQKKIRIFTTSTIIVFPFFISGVHLWWSTTLGCQRVKVNRKVTLMLGMWKFLGVSCLGLRSSFNLWETRAEATRLAFVLVNESLVESWIKGALSPHRGNRRRMTPCPEEIELVEMMFFIFSHMRYRRRRGLHYRRTLRGQNPM